MSIQHYIKCEMCDTKHEITFLYKSAIWRELPAEWLTLFSSGSDATGNDGWHFCSEACLLEWTAGSIAQEESNKPPCKARRFVMSSNTGALPTEGVMWPDGPVYLEYSFGHGSYHCSGQFNNWAYFMELHADYKITWIDQEEES